MREYFVNQTVTTNCLTTQFCVHVMILEAHQYKKMEIGCDEIYFFFVGQIIHGSSGISSSRTLAQFLQRGL